MGDKADMNKANEVRPIFRRLAEVAELSLIHIFEKRREYDRIKAREYRAKKKAQAAAALSAP